MIIFSHFVFIILCAKALSLLGGVFLYLLGMLKCDVWFAPNSCRCDVRGIGMFTELHRDVSSSWWFVDRLIKDI